MDGYLLHCLVECTKELLFVNRLCTWNCLSRLSNGMIKTILLGFDTISTRTLFTASPVTVIFLTYGILSE